LDLSANSAQVEYWNEKAGPTWARLHEALDRQIGALGEEALRSLALGAGEIVLDIGCGCGQTTLEIANRIGPSGTVIGVDISTPMLAIARQRPLPRVAGRIEFRHTDVQSADLGQQAFDAMFSRFGIMFFSDPAAAFANLRRALRPDGRIAFVCWRPLRENPWMYEPLEAARPLLPPLTPGNPDGPGPFAFEDPDRVRAILDAARFADIEIRRHDAAIGSGSLEETVQLALQVGPLGAALREHPSYAERVTGQVRDVFGRWVSNGRVSMPASVWVVHARNSHTR